jgi:hypothetical protein
MNHFVKTLLLWFVIAALPIRGLAAIDTSCAHAPKNALASASVLERHHQINAGFHLEKSGDFTEAMVEPPSDDKGAAHEQLHLKNAGCGGSVCYIGAAAPPFSLAWTAQYEGSETANNLPSASFTGFIPAGLERPPRHFLG